LKNVKALNFLNPYNEVTKKAAKEAHEAGKKKNQELLKAKRGLSARLSADQKKAKNELHKSSKKWISNFYKNIDDSYKRDIAAQKALEAEDLEWSEWFIRDCSMVLNNITL